MKTIVNNVLTNDKMIFINDLSLVDNMVNAIISIEKKTSNLMNESLRKKIIAENNLIEHTSKITGRSFVYCEKYDLIAHLSTNN
jgi:hypothetical protein